MTNVRAYPQGLLFEMVLEQAFDDGTLSDVGLHSKPDVRVWVEFADGSSWQADENRVTKCLIRLGHSSSSGDGGASWTAEYFLPTLPPAGPVMFFDALAGRNGRGTIEGDDIRRAAEKAVDLCV